MRLGEHEEALQTPFTEILAWAQGLPLWHHQALRTILATNAPISRAGIKQLADLCLAEAGGGKVAVKPLGAEDLPLAGAALEPITLVGFGEAQNVNALKNDQWIQVGPRLTIVFGNNATGKTGYARILKKAFRARVVDELQPNIRADKLESGPAAATFEFQRGSEPSRKVTWRTDAPLGADIASRFAVLDASCGHAYLVNNELQLAPQGLDVLPRLVEALDLVRAEVASRRSGLSLERPFLVGISPETSVAQTVQRITATTVLSDVLPSLAFTDASAERLEAAKDEVAQLRTPKQVVRQLEAARQAAEALCGSLETRQGLTSKQAVDELGALRTAAKAANAIADKVESLTADQKVIKSVGSDAWMNLIQAAAEFVEENQSEKLELKQRCPLCLEKLPDSAKARLTRFWEAVHGQASEQRASAETALQQRIDELAEIAKGRAELEALVTVVEPHAPLLRLSFDAAMTSTEATVKKLKSSKPTNGVDISDALDGVRKAVTTIAGKSAALENGTVGAAAEVARLNREIQELEARKLLAGRTGPIQEYVTALRMADQLDAAHASIKTLGATQKSGDLNERYITDSYRKGVEAELKRLGFARPVPVLTQQGSKGKIRILTLANPKFKNVAPDQIFSEGERTAIAIASFFSELGLTPSPVGLIFDDPISSLDHRTREKVAERLVAEAARRQVIVFTHDLVFLTELNGFAREKAVPVTTCELSSTSSVVGLVATDPPWDTQKVSARATKLEGLLADATAEDAAGDAAGLALTLDHFYRLMRSTWEQFIEEKLLNGALERFSRQIKPNSLLEVSFDKSLVKKVVNQINELSGLIEAHDHSAAMNAPRLTVADAAGRLRALRDAGSLETSS